MTAASISKSQVSGVEVIFAGGEIAELLREVANYLEANGMKSLDFLTYDDCEGVNSITIHRLSTIPGSND